ncbi:MAG: CAP domain-containing protein [Proteobacteria bacterium]|nr:CAP domain-containing protein [Pseudomonadota bacterium]
MLVLLMACAAQLTALLTAPAMAEPYVSFATRLVENPPEGVRFRPDLEDVLVGSANVYRQGKRVKGLAKVNDGKLLLAARAHALDLLQQNAMGHRSSTGYDFESRMRSLFPGMMFMSRMAENAARERSKGPADAAKAQKLFQQWVKSTSHRKALLSRDYTRVATGVVQKGDVIYAVQIFTGPEVKSNLFQSKQEPPEDDPAALY